ncbi:MAG: hypothetical protein GX937_13455 [Lentisphaerae bacterium]|jgi:hypothetical protein|nr:hypothetical protein [Lentisphaerota bacterium]
MTRFFFAVSLAALLPSPLQAWEIIKDGQPQAVIVLPDQPLPVESYAAEELRYILKKATGVELAIAAPSAIPDGMKRILLGRAAALDLEGLPLCGFRIVSAADSLALAGRDGTGAISSACKLRPALFTPSMNGRNRNCTCAGSGLVKAAK